MGERSHSARWAQHRNTRLPACRARAALGCFRGDQEKEGKREAVGKLQPTSEAQRENRDLTAEYVHVACCAAMCLLRRRRKHRRGSRSKQLELHERELSAVLRPLQYGKAECQSSRLCTTGACHRKSNARCWAAREKQHDMMAHRKFAGLG